MWYNFVFPVIIGVVALAFAIYLLHLDRDKEANTRVVEKLRSGKLKLLFKNPDTAERAWTVLKGRIFILLLFIVLFTLFYLFP